MCKSGKTLFLVVVLLVVVGLPLLSVILIRCGGGKPPPRILPPPPPPPPPPPEDRIEDYKQEIEEELEPWSEPDKGAVKGTVQISGFTIINPNSLEPGSNEDAMRYVITRIVDPEDDVGSVVSPNPFGVFIHRDVDPLPYGFLEVAFTVAEDVNGDGVGNDKISVRVPISVEAQVITSVNVKISPASAEEIPDIEQVGSPPPSPVLPLKVSSTYKGPDGERTNSVSIFTWLGKAIRDLNLNGKFDLEDGVFDDKNADGVLDSSEEVFKSLAREEELPRVSFDGTIVDLDLTLKGVVMFVRDGMSGVVRPVLITDRTIVLIAEMGGNRFMQAPVARRELMGRMVFVEAIILPGGDLVGLIVIVEP